MSVTRREFGKLAMATVPAALIGDRSLTAQSRPSSVINGVQIGVITYSYRAMPEQGADAVLRYVLDSGINAVELMGTAIESYLGAPAMPRSPGGQGGPGGPGGPGRQPPTPEQVAAREKYAAELQTFRLARGQLLQGSRAREMAGRDVVGRLVHREERLRDLAGEAGHHRVEGGEVDQEEGQDAPRRPPEAGVEAGRRHVDEHAPAGRGHAPIGRVPPAQLDSRVAAPPCTGGA